MDFPQLPYPPDTRAKGYRFELNYERINQSDTWALASDEQRPWLLMLWFIAWQQTPCGTLPDDDILIAARLGMDRCAFSDHRHVLLRKWGKRSDGRLYHPVITELVLEKIKRKERETQRKAAYREKKQSKDVPQMSHGTDTGQTRDSGGSDDTGTGTGISKPPSLRDVPPSGSAKQKSITFSQWLVETKTKGEKAVSDYAPVWEYARTIQIPDDWIEIAWLKFKERYTTDEKAIKKRYIDWRGVFLRAVKENWLGLWFYSEKSQAFCLTTVGVCSDIDTREAA